MLQFLLFPSRFSYKIKCKKSEKEAERYKTESENAKVLYLSNQKKNSTPSRGAGSNLGQRGGGGMGGAASRKRTLYFALANK